MLVHAFERAVEEQSCRLFTVLGPPGIGKSRLVEELADGLGGRGHVPARPLPALRRGRHLLAAHRGAATRSRSFDAAVRETSRAGAPPGPRAHGGRARGPARPKKPSGRFGGCSRRRRRQRPLVVCLEDVHWAEPTLLDLVEYLVRLEPRMPAILLVCLARRSSGAATLAHRSRGNADALALEPLSTDQASALLDRLSAGLDSEERARIGIAAEGNPLFLEQMAAMAAENGHGDLAVPPSIHALLAERLERLSREERAVIECSSVIGRDFSMAAVASLSPDELRPSLGSHLLSLVRKGFVRPDPYPHAKTDSASTTSSSVTLPTERCRRSSGPTCTSAWRRGRQSVRRPSSRS